MPCTVLASYRTVQTKNKYTTEHENTYPFLIKIIVVTYNIIIIAVRSMQREYAPPHHRVNCLKYLSPQWLVIIALNTTSTKSSIKCTAALECKSIEFGLHGCLAFLLLRGGLVNGVLRFCFQIGLRHISGRDNINRRSIIATQLAMNM